MTATRWDTIIIGGGAAGLFAAGTAAARGRKVLLLEKNNKAGPKILMSGGTRCNITHNCDSRKIAEAFGKNGRALLSPLARMSPQDVIQVFESEGVLTKAEETGKIFPQSDRAIDVRDALVNRLTRHGAQLLTGTPARQVRPSPTGAGFEVVLDDTTLWSETILITTGGLSYSGCGTTGDGYAWVKGMGHTVTSLRPALTPLRSSAAWVHALSGLTLDDVSVKAIPDSGQGKKLERAESRGGLLFTHHGCSGPTAMNVSRCYDDHQDLTRALMALDLLPDISHVACEEWLQEGGRSGGKSIATWVAQKIPRRLTDALLAEVKVAAELRAAELSKGARQQIAERLKGWRVPILGTLGYDKAEVTSGGVPVGEVSFQDMQSKKCPGLFLAGEMLDLDGPIGGFNFQAAWSTGHTAGLHL